MSAADPEGPPNTRRVSQVDTAPSGIPLFSLNGRAHGLRKNSTFQKNLVKFLLGFRQGDNGTANADANPIGPTDRRPDDNIEIR